MTAAEQIIQFLLENESGSEGPRHRFKPPDKPTVSRAVKAGDYLTSYGRWMLLIGGKMYAGKSFYDAVKEAFLDGAFAPEYPPNCLGFWPRKSGILRKYGAKIIRRPPKNPSGDFGDDFVWQDSLGRVEDVD